MSALFGPNYGGIDDGLTDAEEAEELPEADDSDEVCEGIPLVGVTVLRPAISYSPEVCGEAEDEK